MSSSLNPRRVNGRDLINVGIFTALLAAVCMAVMPLGFIPILMPLHCVLKMVEYRLAPIMMCPLLILVCVAAFVTWALGELGVSHDAYGRAQPRELPLRI